jgi:hypothetical protein
MPIKNFTSGSVLPASDVNTFLMNQSVMVFASAAARNAAITSPTEGMMTYLSDTNSLNIYDGANWVGAVNTGSLNGYTGVTYADISINTGTAGAWRMLTIPASKTFDQVVSCIPYGGVNDVVFFYGLCLGNWTGVQTPTQAQVYCHLGNAVASPNSTVRFYFRSV